MTDEVIPFLKPLLDSGPVHICVTCRRPRLQRLLTEEIHRSTRVSYKHSHRAILLLYRLICTCVYKYGQSSAGMLSCLLDFGRILEVVNDWTSQAPQLSGDSSPGCTAVFRSLVYPRTGALQVTNLKLRLL